MLAESHLVRGAWIEIITTSVFPVVPQPSHLATMIIQFEYENTERLVIIWKNKCRKFNYLQRSNAVFADLKFHRKNDYME